MARIHLLQLFVKLVDLFPESFCLCAPACLPDGTDFGALNRRRASLRNLTTELQQITALLSALLDRGGNAGWCSRASSVLVAFASMACGASSGKNSCSKPP